jgi:hypothetical protein
MLPIFVHDINNNFPQTIKFIAWMGYRILVLFGYPPLHPEIPAPQLSTFIDFALSSYQKLIVPEFAILALIIFIFSFFIFYKEILMQIKTKTYKKNWILLAVIVTVSVLAFLAIKTPSEAYLPMLFPGLILLTAVSLNKALHKKIITYPLWTAIIALAMINSYYLFSTINQAYPVFTQRLNVAGQIITQSKGKEYNLKWGSVPSREADTHNYQYLIWWLGGNDPSTNQENLEFIIYEEDKEIKIIKK